MQIVVLCATLAVATARPGIISAPSAAVVYTVPKAATTYTVHQPAYAHVGSVLKSVPSSISHQSHSVVHGNTHVVEDVLAPALHTTSYTKTISAAPVVQTYAAAPIFSEPVVKTVSTPVIYKTW